MKLANQEELNKARGSQISGFVSYDALYDMITIPSCVYGMRPIHVSREAIEDW
jgi:hypothetical protein